MEGIKFTIYGKNAFFKNPENNIGTEFSFAHLHKPALLGILGCILGLDGIAQIKNKGDMPEYYNLLKDIKVSVVPNSAIFNSSVESITNNTGFANAGGYAQIVTKEILEKVEWTVYILKSSMEEILYNKLKIMLINHESVYPLYLGSNNYKAQIKDVEEIILNMKMDIEEITVNSIIPRGVIKEKYDYTETDLITPFDLLTYAPYDINNLLLYNYGWQEHTNLLLDLKDSSNLFTHDNNILYFM